MDFNKYQPPVRTSLSDTELDAKVSAASQTGNGVEAVMELLVAQEALRATEDAAITNWLAEMQAIGSPESLLAAENYQRSLLGLEPLEAIAQAETPVAEAPVAEAPVAEAAAVEAPAIEVVTESQDVVEDDKPFSFLNFNTEPDEEPFEAVAVAEPEVQVPATESAPETIAFEDLLSANAAEEEVSAIEEREAIAQVLLSQDQEPLQNVAVPTDKYRNRKPASQLLTWLAINSTLVPFVLAWVMMGQLHLSWQVSLFDAVAGFLAAGLIVSIASLAGKRSGLSTLIISRAIFGVGGNLVVAITVALARLATIGFMVLLVAVMFVHQPNAAIADQKLFSLGSHAFSTGQALGVGALVLALALALLIQPVQRWLQIVAGTIAAVVMVFLLITLALEGFKPQGYTVSEYFGSNSLTAIGLVVSVVIALWFTVAPNLAKSIPMKARGLRVVLYSLLINGLWPASIAAVAVLAFASNPVLLAQFAYPVYALEQNSNLSNSLVISILVATAVALVAWLTSAVSALASDVQALIYSNSKALSNSIAATVLVATIFATVFVADFSTVDYQLQLLLLAAVFSAAFAGLFLADVILRRIAYHEVSLSRAYGFYKRFNALGLVTWILSLAVGLSVAHIDFAGLEYTGFAQGYLGLKNDIFSAVDGTMLALATGFVLSLILRVPNIKRQEREVLAVESRRTALNDIFVGNE